MLPATKWKDLRGYYVRIYSDKIVILGRNFVSGTYVANACYVFDAF